MANYFGYKIGENPKDIDHGSTFRKIDPRNATLATVLEMGKTPSRKPSVAGSSVHKFNRVFVKALQQSLDHREERVIEDERPGFLAMEREIAKKWLEHAKKSVPQSLKTKAARKKRVHDYIQNRSNGEKIYESLVNSKKRGATADFKKRQQREVIRTSHKMTMKNARRVDFMLQATAK